MSGWLGIVALLITTIGGSFGVTFLNNRKELIKMKLKMQEENEEKLETKLKKYIEYIEGKLETSNNRAESLYRQYIELQNQAIAREAELQSEKQKTLSAIQELQIVKHEYQTLKEEFSREKKRLEDENKTHRDNIDTLNYQIKWLLERIKNLETGQKELNAEMHNKPTL